VLFIARPILSLDYGPSSDEFYHKPVGELSYMYLKSFGQNDSIFRFKANDRDDPTLLYNYGPLVDITATTVYETLGTDVFYTRHVLIALFTFLFYLFCGLTAKRLGGWQAGCLALLFAIIAPRLWGEGFNNPKDSTFAAMYIMSLYYIIVFTDELPKPRWKTTLLLMLSIGLAFGIRVGALLLFVYLGLALLYDIFSQKEIRKQFLGLDKNFYKPLIVRLIVVFVGFWIIGISTWPAALKHPFSQPLVALSTFSKFPTIIKTLFEGQTMWSNEVPWYYTPLYILITTPVITLIGAALGILLWPLMKKTGYNRKRVLLIIFSFAFPLFYIAYSKSPLYNGWRHSYFVFGGIAVLSGLGYDVIIKYLSPKWAQIGVLCLIAIGAFSPIRFMIKNHPLEYVYINELKGGVDGSYGDYQIDYYAHSAKPAADWFRENVPYDSKLKIVSNIPWELEQVWKSAKSPWKPGYIRFRERYDTDWDYAILLPQFVDVNILKSGLFVQKGTIHEVMVDNSPIAIIIKRENKNDLLGKQAFEKQNFPEAVRLLKDAVTYNPNNEIAQANYGQALLNTGNMKEAENAFTKAVSISPEKVDALYGLAIAQLQQNNVQGGIYNLSRVIEINPNFPEPYRVLASMYAQQGDRATAERYMSAYQQLTQGRK
jgi:tetratricopeptide (TPR) repeat protein